MNVQAIKLGLIEWLVRLQDEKTIKELQTIREKEFVRDYERSLKPFTEKEFSDRVRASEEDIKYGRTISLEDFVKESEGWQ
jgi:hypothetical protein